MQHGHTSDDLDAWCRDAGWVRALAARLVADAGAADDVAQEAWLRALRARRPDPAAFRAWIAAVVRNVASSRRRGENVRRERERSSDPPPHPEDPVATLARLEAHELVVAAVRALDEPYRSAIVQRWLEGRSPRAIAASTGTPLRTVHTRLQRGMAQLRARLGARDPRWRAALLPVVGIGRGLLILTMTAKTKLLLVAGACVAAALTLAWPKSPPPAETTAAPARLADAPPQLPDQAAPVADRVRVAPPTEAPPTAPPADQPAAPWPLRGVVLDLDGRPVDAVGVVFRAFFAAEGTRTATGYDGSFALTLPAAQGGHVDVDDPGWATVYRAVLWGNPDVDDLTIVATPAAPVTGLVVDDRGAPLADAELSLVVPLPDRGRFGRDLARALDGEWKATTGEDGRFELPRAPALPGVRLLASCRGHDSTDVEVRAPRAPLTLVLAARRSILRGHVVAADGAPTAATVFCGASAAMAGADGSFELDLGSAGEDPQRQTHRWLVAARQGFVPARLRCPAEPPGDPSSWPQPLVLRLGGPTLSISGRAVQHDGTPLESPSVTVLDPEPLGDPASGTPRTMQTVEFLARVSSSITEMGTAFSEMGGAPSNGHFSIGGLQDRAYRLRLEDAPMLLRLDTGPIAAGTHDLELRMPQEALWPRVTGVVVDRRGQPVPDAAIRFERSLPDGSAWQTPEVRSDAEGRFERGPLVRLARTALVQSQGSAHPVRIDLTGLPSLDDLRLVAPVVVRVAILPTSSTMAADTARFLRADGLPVAFTITRGNAAWGATDLPLADGRGEVVAVPDDAVQVVLRRDGREILRTPIDLVPGALRELRL